MTTFKKHGVVGAIILVLMLLAGSSVMAQGTVLADSGFRPQQHGFSFENYGNDSNPVNLTPNSMYSIFGNRVCKAVQEGNCVLTATAQVWMNKVNQDMAGGHCEGMAALSKLVYNGQINIKDLDPNANSIADLKPDNPLVQAEIARWFATQYVPPTASQEIRDQSPSQITDTLIQNLQQGNGPFTMGIYAADGSGGHAITPYSVVDMGDGIQRIMVYDNNYPGQERFIEVDRNSNTWKYTGTTNPNEPVSEYSGNADSFSLTLTPANARTSLPQDCTFCKPDDGGGAEGTVNVTGSALVNGSGSPIVTPEMDTAATPEAMAGPMVAPELTEDPCNQTAVTTGPNTDLVVSTADGRRAGVVNGKPFSNIAGVTILRPRSQTGLDDDTPGAVVFLPRDASDGPMSVTVNGPGSNNVTMMNCGQYQQVEGLSQEDGTPDTISLEPDASYITVEVDPDESLTLDGGYNNPAGDDQTYTLENVESTDGSVISIGADPETGEFNYESSGDTTFNATFGALNQEGDLTEAAYESGTDAGAGLFIDLASAVYDEAADFESYEADPALFDAYIEAVEAAEALLGELLADIGEDDFVDEDGDGIDDNTGEEIPTDEFVDEDGDGIDDVTGEEIPTDEFVDEDGDGIDDVTGEEIPTDDFVDEDGDGIDDVTGEEIPTDEFVDEDGDGIDDVTGEEIPTDDFVDEDGDGIDDNTGEEIPADETDPGADDGGEGDGDGEGE